MLTIALFIYLFIYQCLFHNKIRDFKNNIQTEVLRRINMSDAPRPAPVGDAKRLLHYSGCDRSVS